jgi:spore coat polysaccharide biosynthesis protein SpsF (cytidylyltransferase family)
MLVRRYLEMKTGIIITARVKSSRLKNKVLQTINDKMTIEILIDHLQLQKEHPIVLAIPANTENSVLKSVADKMEIDCYRGEDDSPLHRLYNCARQFKFDNIVRITADDIIIDPSLLVRQVRFHDGGSQDYTFMKRCPEGIAGEVIKVSALERVVKEHPEPMEFISYYLRTSQFKYKEFYPPYEYQRQYRLTMDYPEDLTLLRLVYNMIPAPVGTLDIINLLRKNKYMLSINHLPMITVYTVNYNYSKYIIDTIKSILNQSFFDIEYIVYDDCSTDDSVNRIVEFCSSLNPAMQKKIKILRGKENIGLPAVCNKVLGMAKGRYIIRVDSDDVLMPTALSDMFAIIDKNKNDDNSIDCIYTDYYKFDDDGNTESVRNKERHPGCCLINKKAANEVKYKDGLPFYEGLEFFKRFDLSFKSYHLMSVLWGYRQHEKQKTAPENKDKREKVKKEIDSI